MNNSELLEKVKKVRNNLDCCAEKLKNAQDILNESITFDDAGFKSGEIDLLRTQLYVKMIILERKIIPGVEQM